MTDTDQDKLVKRISSLLTLADGDRNSSENEAASALRKAQVLMAEHGISMAEIELLDDSEVSAGDQYEWANACGMDINDGSCAWEKRMAHAVENITTTSFVIERGKRINNAGKVRNYTRFLFYGHKADVQIAAVLFPIMRKMARRFARRRIGDGWTIEHRSYCQGFARTCFDRSKTEFTDEETDGKAECFALVVQRKKSWVDEMAEKEGRKTSPGRVSDVDPISFAMGQQDGRNVDLGFSDHIE